MLNIFQDSPEYSKRKETPFVPSKVTLAEIHAAVPKHLYNKSTIKSLFYVARDISCGLIAYKLAVLIEPFGQSLQLMGLNSTVTRLIKFALWATYWHWQGVIFAGLWCLGHEAGHGTMSPYGWVNHAIGYSLHTFLLVPYYAWRSTHHAHHHFLPSSPLFKPHERNDIIASNIGLATMSTVLWIYTGNVGLATFIKIYFIPYLLANHWIVMLTYLHHSDPTIPHFRNKEWTFLRGALATVDRPLLGWAGRFFLHNVSHDHIGHHLFSTIPFYNQPQVTEHIKRVLKEDYNYDSTNTFRALYRTFTQCCFIEDDGDIVFYKNKDGESARVLAKSVAQKTT
ncbi:hypothetical protein EYR40_000515 [Pleurotus pulmonarius]|nr:hypothetical protein EYR40_000515 [Pleurotus pulmonarius]